MKTPVFPRTVAFLILGTVAPLSAQNLVSSLDLSESRLKQEASIPPGTCDVPSLERVRGEASNDTSVIASQDVATLNIKPSGETKVNEVVDLDILRQPSPYRKVLVSAHTGQPYEVDSNSLQAGLAEISAVYRESGSTEKSSDCDSIGLSVEKQVKLDASKVLEIVELEVGANKACACEVVKAAIKASEAEVKDVVSIVETAIHAAPETMRIVSQCAIASSPESVTEVQALLARLDPNAGKTGYSAKSSKSDSKDSKDAKVASIVAPPLPNPLDVPPYGPPLPPPPPIPPPVTEVNPCAYYR